MLPACQSRGTGSASNNRVNGIVLQPKFEKKEGRKKWIGWCNHQKRLLALTGGAVATKSGVAGKLSRGVSRSWVVPFLPSLWQDQRLTRLKKLGPELGFGKRAGPVCLFLVFNMVFTFQKIVMMLFSFSWRVGLNRRLVQNWSFCVCVLLFVAVVFLLLHDQSLHLCLLCMCL